MTFGSALHRYRLRCCRTQSGLARDVGVDPSYLNRIERSERAAPQLGVMRSLTRVLRLSPTEEAEFAIAGGYAPESLVRLGGWDPALQSVVDVLLADGCDEQDRAEFRALVVMAAARWTRGRES